MTTVRATERGYFGLTLIEPGDIFDVPDEIWNDERRRPSWAEPIKGRPAASVAEDDDADRKPRRGRPAKHAELEPEPDWLPREAMAKQVDE